MKTLKNGNLIYIFARIKYNINYNRIKNNLWKKGRDQLVEILMNKKFFLQKIACIIFPRILTYLLNFTHIIRLVQKLKKKYKKQ